MALYDEISSFWEDPRYDQSPEELENDIFFDDSTCVDDTPSHDKDIYDNIFPYGYHDTYYD